MPNTIILKNNQADQIDVYHYPDGQQSVCLKLDQLDVKKPIHIKCRVRNFSELEVLIALVAALKRNDFYLERIDYIYLFGMRSDRAFKPGEPSYFKDVVVPILKSFGVNDVRILFPHNKIILNLMNADFIKIIKSLDYEFMWDKNKEILFGDVNSHFLNECLREPLTILTSFQKTRIGENFVIDLSDNEKEILSDADYPILIMDDLCDAGGTFISEAIYLRELGVKSPLHLFVGHGLFTKGLEPLLEHFEHIYCTNSYQDIDHPRITQLKVI